MSIRKRFNEILGLNDGVEDEKKRFVERVNQVIFHHVDTEKADSYEFNYRELFEDMCFELGVNAHAFPTRLSMHSLEEMPPEIRTLTDNDFAKTLEALCAMYEHIRHSNDPDEGQEWLSQEIKEVLSRCTCDIGVRWKDGFFYPSGAEELDKALIEDTLTWLRDYPDERKDYRTALQSCVAGDALADVIKNCYSAVEGVVRNVLGNKKTLDNNKDELLVNAHLSDGWKSLLANYVRYAHGYRHASAERHKITRHEAEAYLYMTGLILRLIIESKSP